MADWSRKIEALKRLIGEVGSIWPSPSTKLAGYAEAGPYHCEDCTFLKRDAQGVPVKVAGGRGVCNHPMMKADREVQHEESGNALVNIEHGCCEFVDQKRD